MPQKTIDPLDDSNPLLLEHVTQPPSTTDAQLDESAKQLEVTPHKEAAPTKVLLEPWVRYNGCITQEQWEKFQAYCVTLAMWDIQMGEDMETWS